MRAIAFLLCVLGAAACSAHGCQGTTPALPFDRVFGFEAKGQSAAVIDLSPDGRRVLLASATGTVLSYAEPWGVPVEHDTGATLIGAGLLRGGETFIATRGRVEVWNDALSQRARELPIPPLSPDLSRTRVALSPNRRYIAVDDAVYEVDAARWVLPPYGHGHQTALAFAGDGHVLTAGFHDQTVALRSLPTGERRAWQAPAPITAAAVTRDARRVAIATADGVASWDPNTPEPSNTAAIDGASDLRLCADDKLVAVLGRRAVYVLELPALKERARFMLEAAGTALGCDGALLAAGDEAGRVYTWDLGSASAIGSEPLLRAPVSLLAVSASARRVLAVANDERGAQALLLKGRGSP